MSILNPATINRLYFYLVGLYAFILPISYKHSIKVLVILAVLAILKERKKLFTTNLYPFRFLLTFLVVGFIGVFFSDSIAEAVSIFANKYLLILAFIIVALGIEKPIDFKFISLAFAAGTLTATLICVVYAIHRDLSEGAYWAYYHLVFTDIINSHPIYLGYYINFSIAIIVYYLIDKSKSKRTILLSTFTILYFVFIHVLLSGRVPIIALMICFLFWFVLIKFRGKIVLPVLLIILATSVFTYFLDYRTIVLERFKDLFTNQYSLTDTSYGGYVERVMLWKAGIMANDNLLFGVGIGDTQKHLDEYYKVHNYHPSFVEEGYNSHNQFVQLFLSHGLLGLACFLILLFDPVRSAIRDRDLLKFMFFAPFVIYGITEVFLGRFQGIGFYYFFYILLIVSNHHHASSGNANSSLENTH